MQGSLQETRRREVHHQWKRLLRASADQQRRRARVSPGSLGQGLEDRLDGNVEELGSELAVQRLPQWPVHVFQGHDHGRRDQGVRGHCAI